MQGVVSRHPPGAVCMITGDITRYALSMQSLMGLKVPPGSVSAWYTGVLISKSINLAFQAMMDNPALQWAWVMGDDHTYDKDTVLNLLDSEKDVVVPLCLNRLPPLDPTIVEHDGSGGPGRMKYLEDLPPGGLYRLKDNETCGDAGMLIRRAALERLGPPWYDARKSGAHAAEDQAFIQGVKAAGFDVWVNLDVQIGHIGHVNMVPVLKPATATEPAHWVVRMIGGGLRTITEVRHKNRKPDEERIAAEPGKAAAA